MTPWETADKTNLRREKKRVKLLWKKFEFLIKCEFEIKLITYTVALCSVSNILKPSCLVM